MSVLIETNIEKTWTTANAEIILQKRSNRTRTQPSTPRTEMSLVAHTVPETLTITGTRFLTMIPLRSKKLYHIQKTIVAIQTQSITLAIYDKTPKPYNVILVTKT